MADPNDRYARILENVRQLGREFEEQSRDELEDITDLLIEELLDRIPLPKYVPFLRGWLRKKLDALLPEALFDAIRAAVLKGIARRGHRDPLGFTIDPKP